METANTILQQLGGNRFIAMTGASSFVGGDNFLMFKLPRGVADKSNKVKITLTAMDDYIVETFKIGRGDCRPCSYKEGVYADTLRPVFESITGLRTSL